MPANNCPYCSAQLFDDGTCPECGQSEVAEHSLSAVEGHSVEDRQERRSSDEQASAVDAGLIDGETEIEDQPVTTTPTLGFFGAAGWCLVLLLAQAAVGCGLSVIMAATGSFASFAEDRASFLVVFLATGNLVMLAIGWTQLAPDAARKMAIRELHSFHVVIVALLVLPLAVLCMGIANVAGDALDFVLGADAFPAAALPRFLSGEVAYAGLYEEVFDVIAHQPWAIVFLLGCLLPGVCEEMFFRGFLGRGLLARYGVVGGVAITSLLFGLLHVDPVHGCYTFVLGVVLHCVYLWTRSFWGPVALHTCFNLFGFGTRKLSLEGTLVLAGPDEHLRIPYWLGAAALAATIALGYLLRQSRTRFQVSEEEDLFWSPGYATAAIPPASFAGTTRTRLPGRFSVTITSASYLLFGLTFLNAASVWFDSNTAWAHFHRGILHAEQEDLRQAVVDYTEALKVDPEMADAYLYRGEAHRMLGSFESALFDYERAIELNPASALSYAGRGETYRLMELREEAIADCDRAIQLESQLAWAYMVRGAIYSENGDCRRAIADFKKAINLEDQHAWTYETLAWELAHCADDRYRDAKQAIRYAEKACELTKWCDAYMLATLAAVYAANDRYEQAVRYQRDALRLAPIDEIAEFRDQLDTYVAARTAVGDL